MPADTYTTVHACCLALLAGEILTADNVTAGNGMVVDWREHHNGVTVIEKADAFDVAMRFVAIVGNDAALQAAEVEEYA